MTECTREFKVGDKVVLENEPSLAQILQTDGRWSIIKWLDDNTESNVRLDFLRHATDEEIAAGRRLDHFRDVADVENHISPKCRINCFQDDTSMGTRTVDIESENERLKTENLAMQVEIDLLKEALDIKESLNNALRARDEARQSMPIKYAE